MNIGFGEYIGNPSYPRALESKTVPGVPANLKRSNELNPVNITWTAPDDGNDTITNYDINYRIQGESDWESTITNSKPSFSFSNLLVNNIYEIRIAAINSVGTGNFSDTITTLYQNEPGIPVLTQPPIITDSTVTLHYEPGPNSSAVDSWTFDIVLISDQSVRTITNHKSNQITIDNLKSGEEYLIKLAGANEVSSGSILEVSVTTLESKTVPGVPANLKRSNELNPVNITWTAPDDGNDTITNYDINYRIQGESDWESTITNSKPSFSFSNLLVNNIYEIRIAAINSVGTGNFSDTITTLYQNEPGIPVLTQPPIITDSTVTLHYEPGPNSSAVDSWTFDIVLISDQSVRTITNHKSNQITNR